LAIALTSAAFTSADAADAVPVYKAPPPLLAPIYTPSWAGFYFGAHIGGAWGDLKATDFDEFGPPPVTWSNKPSSVFGGGTAGYNFQNGNIVSGIEVDFGGMGLRSTVAEPGTGGTILSRIDSSFYADVTGRLGFAFDRSLIYAKGGWAFLDARITDIDVGEAETSIKNIAGWTLGAGIEYKFAPYWSVKAEYQFFDFGTHRLILPTDGDRYDDRLTIQTVKAGINYHFNP
jgi:outer membrane immunogenic protein